MGIVMIFYAVNLPVQIRTDYRCCKFNTTHFLTLLFLLGMGFSTSADNSNQSKFESICINAIRTENFALAQQVCEKQLQQAEQQNNLSSVLALYIALANTHRHLGNDELFSDYLTQAQQHPLFETASESKYQWLRLKAIRLHHTKNLAASNELFSAALQLAIDINDEKKISDSNIDLGISAVAMGDFKTALNHYRTSLELTRQMNDPYATGLSLKSVADAYMRLEEYSAAIKYFDSALSHYEKYTEEPFYDHRVHNRMASVYEGLMEAHQTSGQTVEAKHYVELFEQSQASLSNDHDRASGMVQQAKQLIELEDYAAAIKKLISALNLFQAEGIKNPAEVNYLLAKVYQQTEQLDLAVNFALQAIQSTSDKQTNSPITGQSYLLLSQLYAQSNPAKALRYANAYNQSREVFLNTKYNTDLKTIQHQIELEKNQNKLVTSQLENIKQKVKIQTLNNKYLRALLLLVVLTALIIYLYVKKKRQQTDLLASINYHKNQLAVLSLSTSPKELQADDNSPQKVNQASVNEMLVQIMHDATNLWVEITGENLIELADRSKIWTITNDNGTLRARSLEKYLDIQKIPKNPRWRNVVRTCHFVLAEPTLNPKHRNQLNARLESVIQVIKEFYGTGK